MSAVTCSSMILLELSVISLSFSVYSLSFGRMVVSGIGVANERSWLFTCLVSTFKCGKKKTEPTANDWLVVLKHWNICNGIVLVGGAFFQLEHHDWDSDII